MKLRHRGVLLLVIVVLALASAGISQAGNAEQGLFCNQPPRLAPGLTGRVTLYPNLPNRIRSDYSFAASTLGYIPAGGVFDIISGPVCSSNTHWYQVRYAGLVGWTAEGDGAYVYWLEPWYNVPPNPTPSPNPVCTLYPRLLLGGLGRVTPGLPNTVRNGAGTVGTTRIGRSPAGGVFAVLSGPQCASDGRWWWQVNYNGLIGWTAEGQGATYWLEPYNYTPPPVACLLPNRLVVGGLGRVTPGLPNTVRSAPGTQSTGANSIVIGTIPAGGVFNVLNGPACGSDSRWWWQVNYNGLIGWTAEGEASSGYWLEPWY